MLWREDKEHNYGQGKFYPALYPAQLWRLQPSSGMYQFRCKCPVLTEAVGPGGETIPRARPQGFVVGSILYSDGILNILNIMGPPTSPCQVEFFHVVMSTDPTGQGCVV